MTKTRLRIINASGRDFQCGNAYNQGIFRHTSLPGYE